MKNVVMNILIIVGIVLSFLVVDFGIRYITYDSYQFYSYTKFAPTLFSLGWISLFVAIFYLLSKKIRRYFYIITLVIFNLIGYSQYLHFKILDRFYGISDLFLAKEGSSYFKYAIASTDIKIIIIMLISIGLGIVVFIFSNKYHEMYRDKLYFGFVLFFAVLSVGGFFLCAHFRLGEDSDNSSYLASTNPIDVYKDFNNPNKNMQVVGLYESVFRGFYIYVKDLVFENNETYSVDVDNYIKEYGYDREDNDYTGIFKDKNVIYIFMESVDSLLVDEEIMPTLYKLKNEGINFSNRYSPVFGGGATINSEFAANVGIYTSLDSNIYNLDNTYKNSLANMFKDNGYSANSIHYNYGYYYNRTLFHENLGYEKHYSLLDFDDIDNEKYDYGMDSNLIESDSVYDLIVRDDKFLSFITTYSLHLPYNAGNERCMYASTMYRLRSGDGDKEFSCVMNLARDTDEMIRLLISRLEEDDRLDDTVLVLVSDHYMYGYEGIEDRRGISDKYLLQNTPFIIWSNDIEHVDVDVVVDTADILPTLLNMFGIDYDPNLYVGEDAFYKDRDNYVYFSSDVYFDGNELYDASKGTGEESIYEEINDKILFNENLIKSNYLNVDK